ncbi:hypothetical protein [Streptomyces sp. NPDC086787]|uniref:hypothetical protein n=1 Tax=Streptomyces sp. NPDC086787 TaxID=3365759 RepID=UPI003804B267
MKENALMERREEWELRGLRPRQLVRCVVAGHRDRFGIDVRIISPIVPNPWAFVDFVLLAERGVQVTPADFPATGAEIKAVTVDIMPDGELRLDARPSSVQEIEAL